MNLNYCLQSLQTAVKKFQSDYERLISLFKVKTLCLTIYNPAFEHFDDLGQMSQYQVSCEISINIFNDIIQRLVKKKGFDLLELRELMIGKNDYANSIEPSHAGGKKIALAVSKWVNNNN